MDGIRTKPLDAPAEKPKKINSRWRKGAVRYSQDRSIDDVRWLRDARGARRKEEDSPSEVMFCERRHAGTGWRNGARIRKR